MLGLAQDALSSISRAGAGFETYGNYFLIQEKGTGKYLINWWCKNTEGIQLHLWHRENAIGLNEKSQVRFFHSVLDYIAQETAYPLDIFPQQIWRVTSRREWPCCRYHRYVYCNSFSYTLDAASSQTMSLFCVVSGPFLVAQIHGRTLCRNSPSLISRYASNFSAIHRCHHVQTNSIPTIHGL